VVVDVVVDFDGDGDHVNHHVNGAVPDPQPVVSRATL
jgi:hypothetical protein